MADTPNENVTSLQGLTVLFLYCKRRQGRAPPTTAGPRNPSIDEGRTMTATTAEAPSSLSADQSMVSTGTLTKCLTGCLTVEQVTASCQACRRVRACTYYGVRVGSIVFCFLIKESQCHHATGTDSWLHGGSRFTSVWIGIPLYSVSWQCVYFRHCVTLCPGKHPPAAAILE